MVNKPKSLFDKSPSSKCNCSGNATNFVKYPYSTYNSIYGSILDPYSYSSFYGHKPYSSINTNPSGSQYKPEDICKSNLLPKPDDICKSNLLYKSEDSNKKSSPCESITEKSTPLSNSESIKEKSPLSNSTKRKHEETEDNSKLEECLTKINSRCDKLESVQTNILRALYSLNSNVKELQVMKTNGVKDTSSNAPIDWFRIDGSMPNFPKRLNELRASSEEVIDEILKAYKRPLDQGRSREQKIKDIYYLLGFHDIKKKWVKV